MKITKLIIIILLFCITVQPVAFASDATAVNTITDEEPLTINQALIGQYNPYVYVSGYEIIEGVVEAGGVFTLRIYVTNANPLANAYNIMTSVFFPGTENFYYPTGTSNQFYIPLLSALETVYVDIELLVKDEIMYEPVLIEFAAVYNNHNGSTFGNNSFVSVMQHKSSEIEISSASVPDTVELNSNSLISLQLTNIGETDLNNLAVTLTGEFEGETAVFEKDILTTGEKFEIDTYLVYNMLGDANLNVSIDFINEAGESQNLEIQDYNLMVEPAGINSVATSTVNLNERPQSGIFSNSSIWLLLLAILAIFATFLVWIYLSKNMKYKKEK